MYACNQNNYGDFLAYTYFVLLKMLSSIILRDFNVCFTLLKGLEFKRLSAAQL